MDKDSIEKAKMAAKRFLAAVREVERRDKEEHKDRLRTHMTYPNIFGPETKPEPRHFYGTKESGALRRASMDLTRALAEMRRPG